MTSYEAMKIVNAASAAAKNEDTTREELVSHILSLSDTLLQAVQVIELLMFSNSRLEEDMGSPIG